MITIDKQIVAQGSYGLRKINRNGTDIGSMMAVWHVHDTSRRSQQPGQYGHHKVGTYLSRDDAREAAAAYRRSA